MKSLKRTCALLLTSGALAAASFTGCNSLKTQNKEDILVKADMSGYGKVVLENLQSEHKCRIQCFNCETPEKADILLGKLKADLSWDNLTGAKETRILNNIPALKFNGQFLLLAEKENQVYAVSGRSPKEIELCIQDLKLNDKSTRFTPLKPYPKYMDYFDNHSLSYYVLPRPVFYPDRKKIYEKEVLKHAIEFMAKKNIGSGFFHAGLMGKQTFGDGVLASKPYELQFDIVNKANSYAAPYFSVVEAPLWIRNMFPEEMVQFDPNMLPVQNPVTIYGAAYPSSFPSDKLEGYLRRHYLRCLKIAQEKLGDNLCAFAVISGQPTTELSFHRWTCAYMDYGPAGQKGYRKYLKEHKKYTLLELGERWFGNPEKFKKWDEVCLQSPVQFFGDYGKNTLNLRTNWKWRSGKGLSQKEKWHSEKYAPGKDWKNIDLAPAGDQLLLSAGKGEDVWYRKDFNVEKWLKKGQKSYLVVYSFRNRNVPYTIYMNGKLVGKLSPYPENSFRGPGYIDVSEFIKDGENALCIVMPGIKGHGADADIINGPVYITSVEPKCYPELGLFKNAQWFDMMNFHLWKQIHRWKERVLPVRHVVPNLPLYLTAGGNNWFAGYLKDLKDKYGLTNIQDTGAGSSFRPGWAELGYRNGVYSTGEEGQTPLKDYKVKSMKTEQAKQDFAAMKLTKEFGFFMIEGRGHHNFYAWIDYYKLEKYTKWFSKNQRLFKLFGKSGWKKPKLAILRVPEDDLLFTDQLKSVLNRGVLTSTHLNNIAVVPENVNEKLAFEYPVLLDNHNRIMSKTTVEALEKYVKAGGTFIAFSESGKSSFTEGESWPISKLTGYKVVSEKKKGVIKILEKNPLLKKLAGKKYDKIRGFYGGWLGINRAGGSYSLKPETKDVVKIAEWEDGSTAIGIRKLGKGKVVTIASSFWEDARDTGGYEMPTEKSVEFLNDLFAGLGVKKQIECSSSSIWARRFITKNGLQEWFVAFNSNKKKTIGATLSCPVERDPGNIFDMMTGKPVKYKYENGKAEINVKLKNHETRVYGYNRMTGISDALAHWLTWKRHFCRKPQLPPCKKIKLPKRTALSLNEFSFQVLKNKKQLREALKTNIDSAQWKKISFGFWDEKGFSKKGIGVYRKEFAIPEKWKGREIILTFAAFAVPVFSPYCDVSIYIDGKKIGGFKDKTGIKAMCYDLTSFARKGKKIDLAIAVKAKQHRGGFFGEIFLTGSNPLKNKLDLKAWNLEGDGKSANVKLPLNAKGNMMKANFKAPGSWKGKKVFLCLNSDEQWLGTILINGRMIHFNNYAHKFPNICRIALNPWIKPGEINDIKLVPHAALPRKSRYTKKSATSNAPIILNEASVGTE